LLPSHAEFSPSEDKGAWAWGWRRGKFNHTVIARSQLPLPYFLFLLSYYLFKYQLKQMLRCISGKPISTSLAGDIAENSNYIIFVNLCAFVSLWQNLTQRPLQETLLRIQTTSSL